MRFVIRDPKKGSSGSFLCVRLPLRQKTHHVVSHVIYETPHVACVVFTVTGQPTPESAALLMMMSCYTSGKS